MKTTDFKFNGSPLSYELKDNGYIIYNDGQPWIKQLDDENGQFGKPIDKNKSYEENCLAQIEELCTVPEPTPDSSASADVETLKAQVEYLAMMSDVDLSTVTEDANA